MNATKEKGRDSSAPTAAAIREIKVSRVEFKPPPKKRKNAGDDAEGWFKVEYSAFITMPDGRTKQIKAYTTKEMANHSTDMMKKTREAIDARARRSWALMFVLVLGHCTWKRMSFGNIFGFLPSVKLVNRNLLQKLGRRQHGKDIKLEQMQLMKRLQYMFSGMRRWT